MQFFIPYNNNNTTPTYPLQSHTIGSGEGSVYADLTLPHREVISNRPLTQVKDSLGKDIMGVQNTINSDKNNDQYPSSTMAK